ncbi:unnamed protein product [Mesocestoides corti]|uniref:Zf-3CxxC domain-containing protein n=2 Tax=Mesocestoides corti TaxID=53468 RepID=A0A0R3U6H1_MESCO|nr:unnamed protein product [Mesocestoides corti]
MPENRLPGGHPDLHDDTVSAQRRSRTICVCTQCVLAYLSDFANCVNTLWPSLGQSAQNTEEPMNIDRDLHANLHILWIGQFVNLFAPLYMTTGVMWYLRPVDKDETILNPALWRTTVKAKVRFECESCQHVWTSMMGTAVFSVYPSISVDNALELCFTLMGQQCTNCDSKVFQSAIWYPEEVIRVLSYIHWQICDEFLMLNGTPQMAALNARNTPPENTSRSRRALLAVRTVCRSVSLAGGRQNPIYQSLLTSRSGRPLKHHNSAQCEACLRGVCLSQKRSLEKTEFKANTRTYTRRRRRCPFTGLTEKKDKATSITPEKVHELAEARTTLKIEEDMFKLCIQVPTHSTMFGSVKAANKREVIVFRSLRCTNVVDSKPDVVEKPWRSCGDLVECLKSFARVTIGDPEVPV